MSHRHTSPLGKIPSGWSLVNLKDVAVKVKSGATPKGGESSYLPKREKFALIRSQNVFDRRFDETGLAFISDAQASELSGAEVQVGDALLNITGDGITFARSALVPERVLPACVNQHVMLIRPQPDKCEPGFLLTYLTHPQIKEYIESFNAGGSRRAITKGHIESFAIPLPPLSEQRAIASVLGALDDKIELNRRMNETLEALAQSLFKSWFADATQSALPEGWRVGRLDEVLVLQRGFDLPSTARTPGPYPVLCASGPNGTHGEFMVRGPGVTTGRSGALGEVYYVHEDFWPHNTSLWVKQFKHSTPIYAFHLLRGLDFGTFNAGSAVPTLNRNHVHNLPVKIPPIDLIQQFEDTALPLYLRLKSNDDESRTLAALRDALLPKLLSGELRVPAAAKLTEASA